MPYGDQYVVKRARYAPDLPPRRKTKRVSRVSMVPIAPGFTRTGGSFGRYVGKDAELKFFDTTVSFTIDATGEVPATGQWNLIPQGVTESTRLGRKCTLRSIAFRGTAQYVPGAAATMNDVAFIYVVLDRQCNGAAAAVTDVLTGANIPSAMINLENEMRFKILKKIRLVYNAQAGVSTAYDSQIKSIDFALKCNIPLEFDNSAATGALTTIRSNNVFILAGTAGGSDDLIGVSGTARVRFSDA